MKSFLIICDQELESEINFILRANHIECYTLFRNAQGCGHSGLKQGDSTGPGLNHVYWIALKEKEAAAFLRELKEFKYQKLKNKGIKIFVLPVEECI